MSHRTTGSQRAALVAVALLGLGLALCLVHGACEGAGDLDMLHGICSPALIVAFFAAGAVFASMNWWLLTGPVVFAYAVSLYLPDPPPKSPTRP